MNIHQHPNTKEYLAHFLLTLRKHTILTDETQFEVQVRKELSEEDSALLK